MRRWHITAVLIFVTALILAVPVRAPGMNAAPALRSAFRLAALRAAVEPGLSPARVGVGASLPRQGGVKPPLRDSALKGGSTTAVPPASAKKPINQVQVFALLVGAKSCTSHRVATVTAVVSAGFPISDGCA